MATTDWTAKNIYFLSLITVGYIFGEIAHFLINTSSRDVARDIKFGDQICYGREANDTDFCVSFEDEKSCSENGELCEWNYSGTGIEYQILAGPAFIFVFTVANIFTGITSDRIAGYSNFVGRQTLMAAGVVVFSTSLFLMGFSNAYWQLVILRMGIAAGEAVCRPTAGSLLADLFTPSGRGLANGIFSWGVYYGYGLAFVIGIYMTQANILGHGWRSAYVISAIPGVVIGILLAITLRDPKSSNTQRQEQPMVAENREADNRVGNYLVNAAKSFCQTPMLLLLLAACVRHTAGFSWAYNTRLYFQKYHPYFDEQLGWWLFGCSVGGGSFGVFFGGFFSDRIVDRLGLHSRLWVLSAFTMLAVPFACLTLYLDPPYALVMLIFYYFCAETWFAILFTVIVEIVDPEVRSASIAIFLFVMNNVGGNLPLIFTPISKVIGYREAIYTIWPGSVALSSILFFVASIPLHRRQNAEI